MQFLRAAVLWTTLALRAFSAIPDLVIFDEDDPLGRDYYDASVGGSNGGSLLKLRASSRDKMPISETSAARGEVSGVMEWLSAPGGDWQLHIFRPGFPLLDTVPYERLTFAVNSPRSIAPDALPLLELQDLRGSRRTIPLSSVLGGTDADSNSWQTVSIALSALQGDPAFQPDRVKHVTFRQNKSDRQAHILWLDDLKFMARDRLEFTNRPPAPLNLTARSGDRTVTLSWNAVQNAGVTRYRVSRKTPDGQFAELPGSPVVMQSVADVHVTNGVSYTYIVRAENHAGLSENSSQISASPKAFATDDHFLEYVQATAFDYFWREANPENGMIRDRTQPWSAASIAAIGFGLSAINIGIDHAWITREAGADRILKTLRTLWSAPQSTNEINTSGYKGWFYHFLTFEDGTRFGTSELSSIDTSLLLTGVLDAQQFFNRDSATEREIRDLARRIFDRVDWNWMLNRGDTLAMGWYPDRGFTSARWRGYNEASILYLLGLGATGPNALAPEHWRNWTKTYDWRTSHGYSFVHFAPLFGHQYTACWIDFRGIQDDYTRAKSITYFENSRRATLAQREYCIANPGRFPGYAPDVWGLTACDGPGSGGAHGYIARGAPPAENDDGTIAPTAAGGSLPFAPEECVRALKAIYDGHRERIWCGYGFRDAFNLKEDWWGQDVIGIDQGPILLMAENMRTGRVWERMRENKVLQRGLAQAGFQPLKK